MDTVDAVKLIIYGVIGVALLLYLVLAIQATVKVAKTKKQRLFLASFGVFFFLLVSSLGMGSLLNSGVLTTAGLAIGCTVVGVGILYGADEASAMWAALRRQDSNGRLYVPKVPQKQTYVWVGSTMLMCGVLLFMTLLVGGSLRIG